MVTLDTIKKDLPAWPDDVIEQWLLYLANRPDTGWPPPEPLGDHPWTYILGHRPLSWWQQVTWKSEKTDCSRAALCAGTRKIVDSTLTDIATGKADEGTKRRYDDAFHHILNKAAFPKPLVAIRLPDGLSVLDGNHRIAAFCGLQKMPAQKFEQLGGKKAAPEQEIWIGTHSKGETPLD